VRLPSASHTLSGEEELFLLELVTVTTPDMDGQSIGGTINIQTPSALDRELTSLQLDTGTNPAEVSRYAILRLLR
jgi:hypothetical protein